MNKWERWSIDSCKTNAELVNTKEGGISFIDRDSVLIRVMFAENGVHLDHDEDIEHETKFLTLAQENHKFSPIRDGAWLTLRCNGMKIGCMNVWGLNVGEL